VIDLALLFQRQRRAPCFDGRKIIDDLDDAGAFLRAYVGKAMLGEPLVCDVVVFAAFRNVGAGGFHAFDAADDQRAAYAKPIVPGHAMAFLDASPRGATGFDRGIVAHQPIPDCTVAKVILAPALDNELTVKRYAAIENDENPVRNVADAPHVANTNAVGSEEFGDG
jgi:hypothetical protein